METCFECGIPLIISKNFEWSPHGQIFKRGSKNRYIIIDCNQLHTLFELFTFLDGPRAATIMCEARRSTLAAEVRDLLGAVISRPHFYSSRRVFGRLQLFFKAFGYGELRLKSYDAKGISVIEFRHPYFQPFAEAEIRAIWEALEGAQAMVVQEEKGDAFVIFKIQNAEEGGKISFTKEMTKAAILEKLTRSKGLSGERTCSTCASPIEASRFTWNAQKGNIYDSAKERHVCMLSASSLSGIVSDLEIHYGDKVHELILRAMRIYTKNLVKGSRILRELGTRSFLRSISVKGETRISGVEESAQGVEMVLEEPWYAHFVSGEIAGWYEYIFNRRCEIKLEEMGDHSKRLRIEK